MSVRHEPKDNATRKRGHKMGETGMLSTIPHATLFRVHTQRGDVGCDGLHSLLSTLRDFDPTDLGFVTVSEVHRNVWDRLTILKKLGKGGLALRFVAPIQIMVQNLTWW